MAKTGTKEAFLLFIVIQQASQPVPPLNYHQHQDWASILKIPTAICSIGFVHVRRCWWWFSVEKERPNTKSEILQNDTFRGTRISCRQRSFAIPLQSPFPPSLFHHLHKSHSRAVYTNETTLINIMHWLTGWMPGFPVLLLGSGRKQDSVTFAI